MKEQTNTAQNKFDLRPVAVKKWIQNLPLGSTGESSKQLYYTLKIVNSQNNSIANHLAFLEAITPTISLLYPRLAKYFSNVSLPLDTKTRNVIHVTSCLLNEILSGYHLILKTLVSEKKFGWKKPFAVALHHTIIYTAQISCTQRLSYQPYQKSAWRDLYWCYLQAEKYKLQNKSFHHHYNNQVKTSIDYELKRLFLLSLISANNLGHKHMQEVHNLMPLWVKNSEILKSEPDDKKSCFTLNLLSDIPPYLYGTRRDGLQQPENRHYLSTHKLKNVLTHCLGKLADNDVIRIKKNILSKSTINTLLNNWTRNTVRQNTRTEGKGFVDIITSISAIHFVLNQQDQPTYDEVSTDLPDNVIDFETTLTIDPVKNNLDNDTLNLGYFLGSTDQDDDVWEKIYDNTILEVRPPANWAETGSFKVYNFTKSILLDYSTDGYRLSVNDKKIDSLKHNELVAIREHALAPWALAQVKWLHFSAKGDVQFGVRILSHHVLPVHVIYQTDNNYSKPLPCLLGLNSKKLMLYVPALPTNLNGKELQLDHQNQHSSIYLKNKILSTPAFDVYEILENKHKSDEKSQFSDSTLIINQQEETIFETDSIWGKF